MVQEAEGPRVRQSGQPERKTRDLHRHWIGIHAKQALLRDASSKRGAIGVSDVRLRAAAIADERTFVGRAHVPERRDEERAGAHRRVHHTKFEQPVGGCFFDQRREGALYDEVRQHLWRVERAGVFALRGVAPGGWPVNLSPRSGLNVQHPFVDGTEFFDAKVSVGDGDATRWFTARAEGNKCPTDGEISRVAVACAASATARGLQRRRCLRGKEMTVEGEHLQRVHLAALPGQAADGRQAVPQAASRRGA